MKIYMPNYEVSNLFDKMKLLDKFIVKMYEIGEIYSDEGIYNVTNSHIFKWNIIDDVIINTDYNDVKLTIDNSKIETEKVTSIPVDHTFIKIHQYHYKINAKSKMELVIKCSNKNAFYFDDTPLHYPIDFYFNIKHDIDINPITNDFLHENLSEFLSLLN
jgi:isopropylmalate/homocitrate/citramalate synthase